MDDKEFDRFYESLSYDQKKLALKNTLRVLIEENGDVEYNEKGNDYIWKNPGESILN